MLDIEFINLISSTSVNTSLCYLSWVS